MTFKGTDWKFFATLLVGILGIVISIYWPLAELKGHALTMSLVSSSALQPSTNSPIHELQVTLNGTKIENPYLSSVSLMNTGSKTVASSDFETAITVSIQGQATLVTAQISGSTPKGIPVELKTENGKIKILPFLSNPNDEIIFAVITSGPPQLVPTARIAGVREIIFQDLTQPQARPFAALLAAIVAATCFFMYTFMLSRGRLFQRVEIGPWIRIPTVFCLALGGTTFLKALAESLAPLQAVAIITAIVATAVGILGGYLALKRANSTHPLPR